MRVIEHVVMRGVFASDKYGRYDRIPRSLISIDFGLSLLFKI